MNKTNNINKDWKKRLIPTSELTTVEEKIHSKNKTIVYVPGAWDILHVGHARYLSIAKSLGDILVVGVASNEVIKKLKGPSRPILDELLRAEMLTYLKPVDLVTIVKETSNQPIIALLKPDVFVAPKESWNKNYKDSKEYKQMQKIGGEFKLIDRQSPFISTTNILKRSVGAHLNEIFKDLIKISKKPLKERHVKDKES